MSAEAVAEGSAASPADAAAVGPPNPKIIDLITPGTEDGRPFISLEYFPPRTEEGVKSLYKRMDRMRDTLHPVFTDMTWGAGGSTADLSLDLALYARRTGHVSNMHLTCTNIAGVTDPKGAILRALKAAHDGGIRNIVALRGDPPAGQEEWTATEGGFSCALDLVKFIREQYGSEFGISVAGYPEGHPNAITEIDDVSTLTETERARASCFDGKTYCCLDADYAKEMDYLKEKVDAGADMIITQMFFDSAIFSTFVKDCRKWGIACPVIPGLMCINNYAGFVKMSKFCKTRVPDSVRDKMEAIKDDPDAVKDYGIEFGTQMCRDLMADGAPVLHFYTLNLEKVVYGVLDSLGLSKNALAATNEADAAAQVAKGSAWARVGDRVTCSLGTGIVEELNEATGAAKVVLVSPPPGQASAVVEVAKGEYSKVF